MGKTNIYHKWKNRQLPIINGILYEEGNINWMNIVNDEKIRKIAQGSKLHIEDIILEEELFWSEIIVLDKVKIIDIESTVYCGGGGYGSEGFIVLESNKENKIIWIAFFEESNPFIRLEVKDDTIYAYNNLNERWSFQINLEEFKKDIEITI